MSRLEVRDLDVRFGGHKALDRVSLSVEPGTVTGLIGPNGAGKTTLFNAVTGMVRPTGGSIEFDGRDISSLATYKRAQLGMARTFQRLELFTSLSVHDNVKAAGDIRKRWRLGRIERTDTAAEATDALARVGLAGRADDEVASLPTGQARLVELARALMTRPSLLLLDEPASGQDEAETEAFGALLRSLRDEGSTILLVEHDMSLVMSCCDWIWVLDFGQVIAGGPPGDIQTDPRVLEAYLGSPA